MTGTLVNAAAIAAGGCVGLLLKKGVKGSHQDSINKALGVAVLVLGLNGVISSMFTVNADGTLASSGELLLIISLVPGTLAGEALRIDDRLNGLSGLVERRLHLSGFAQSFVNGALIYCVGAMAIIGALNDGLRGDASVLYIKSLLDGISSVVLGATLGPGVIFAALPVLVYQGSISLLAGALEPFLAGELLGQICGVGYCLVLCIGATVGENFLSDPGLHRTLLGDGLATAMAGFIGGPANTTYGENTGVLELSRVHDPRVIRIAAVFAIIVSFIPKVSALISTMPSSIIGGVSFMLYGMISAIGVRNVVENKVDLTKSRNLIIAGVIFVCGLGFSNGLSFTIGGTTVTLTALAIAAIAGILLNMILPGNDYEFGVNESGDENRGIHA